MAVIDTTAKLAAFLPILGAAEWVAVDTEADSLHAYPEKVCLIQIGTAFGDRLLDPLAGLDLAPVLAALSGHELIMHGADYDLRLLCKHHEFVPSAIFDTMLAARLAGHLQFGLSHLVEKCLGAKLEKGPQKANWAMRPLTERMERYARNDTHYLKPLADSLRRELEGLGRLAWHREACARLIEDSTRECPPDPDLAWRLKGSHLLSRPALGVLRELWGWRETEAIAANKPPFFVISHDALVNLSAAAAAERPLDPLIPRHLSERRRSGLLGAIARGIAIPPERQPKIPRSKGRRPTDGERRRFAEFQRRRDDHAARLGIDPTLIASRAMLSSLASSWEEHALELMNWQQVLLTS